MPIKRFNVRALMVAIALFALASWAWVLRCRSVEYARKAEECSSRMEYCRTNIYTLTRSVYHDVRTRNLNLPPPDWLKPKIELCQKGYDHAERLYRKYRRSARFPWLTLGPDPADPLPW